MTLSRLTVSVALFTALSAATVAAQTRASIVGTVKDASGGVLPGVTITLASPDMVGGPRVIVTSADGGYQFVDLSPGTYAVSASLSGFEGRQQSDIKIAFGMTLTIDLTLGVGGVAQ